MRVFILSVESGVKECVEMFGLKQYYFLITRLNQGIGQPLRTVLFSAMYLDSVYRVYIHYRCISCSEPSHYFTVVVKYIVHVHTPIIEKSLLITCRMEVGP